MSRPVVGAMYQHYKGHFYVVDGFCKLATPQYYDGEVAVLYHRVNADGSVYELDNTIWARPLDNWCIKVTLSDGSHFERFKQCP